MENVEHFWKFHNADNMDVHTVKLINELEVENKRLREALEYTYVLLTEGIGQNTHAVAIMEQALKEQE